jgi:membrane fusion protein (multidrug efflux system)
MYARIDLVVEVRPDALLVPLEVLTGAEGRPTVLVVRDGKVASTSVELGPTDGPLVQVVKGLSPDAQVIFQGKELVRDGMAVKAVPAKTY